MRRTVMAWFRKPRYEIVCRESTKSVCCGYSIWTAARCRSSCAFRLLIGQVSKLYCFSYKKLCYGCFRYELQISFGGEPNTLRVGFLGYNAQIHAVKYFLEVLKDSIDYIRKNKLQDVEGALKKFAPIDVMTRGTPEK